MKKITKEKLIEIVSSIMLNPTDSVIEGILKDWQNLQKDFKSLSKIDTNNVKPLTHINEQPKVDFLRQDTPDMSWSISKNEILSNAAQKNEDYIIVPDKVVK